MTGLAKIVFVALVVVLVSIWVVGQLFAQGLLPAPFIYSGNVTAGGFPVPDVTPTPVPSASITVLDGTWRRIAPTVFSRGAV